VLFGAIIQMKAKGTAKKSKSAKVEAHECLDYPTDAEMSAMPDFARCEELNWHSMEQFWERELGNADSELFERSKALPGFNAALASVKAGHIMINRRVVGDAMAEGPIDFAEVFFGTLQREPEEAIKTFQLLITKAAQDGDVEFFKRIAREIGKGGRRADERSHLDFYVLAFWLRGFLWLMSDDDGFSYMRSRCDFPFGFAAFQSARRRLSLVGYKTFSAHPIIIGHTKTGFRFRRGWSNLKQV
jgi:hypothetical protein